MIGRVLAGPGEIDYRAFLGRLAVGGHDGAMILAVDNRAALELSVKGVNDAYD